MDKLVAEEAGFSFTEFLGGGGAEEPQQPAAPAQQQQQQQQPQRLGTLATPGPGELGGCQSPVGTAMSCASQHCVHGPAPASSTQPFVAGASVLQFACGTWSKSQGCLLESPVTSELLIYPGLPPPSLCAGSAGAAAAAALAPLQPQQQQQQQLQLMQAQLMYPGSVLAPLGGIPQMQQPSAALQQQLGLAPHLFNPTAAAAGGGGGLPYMQLPGGGAGLATAVSYCRSSVAAEGATCQQCHCR